MTLTKVPAELLGGPRCGQRLALYPFVGNILLPSGKYIRDEEKTKGGRILFRWIAKQKEVVK
jgi:hypothetical protein